MTLVYIVVINVSHKPVVCPHDGQPQTIHYCYNCVLDCYVSGCCVDSTIQGYAWGISNTCTETCNIVELSPVVTDFSSVHIYPGYEEAWLIHSLLLTNPGVEETAAATVGVAALSAVAPTSLAMVGPLGLPQPGVLSAGGGTLPGTAFAVRKVTASYISVTICCSIRIKL